MKQTRLKSNGTLFESVENLKLLKVQQDEQKNKHKDVKTGNLSPEPPSSPRELEDSDEQQMPETVSARLHALYTAAKEWLMPQVQKYCMLVVSKIVKFMEFLAEKHLENGNL